MFGTVALRRNSVAEGDKLKIGQAGPGNSLTVIFDRPDSTNLTVIAEIVSGVCVRMDTHPRKLIAEFCLEDGKILLRYIERPDIKPKSLAEIGYGALMTVTLIPPKD